MRKHRTPEAIWQDEVVRLAHLKHWLVFHVPVTTTYFNNRPVSRTVGQYDAIGFPDLIMAKGGKVLAVELKAGYNKPTSAQRHWIEAAGGYVMYPEDRPELMRLLGYSESEINN